ncbi:MAG: HipA domain-containing protein [Planctomycetota bacterium]
MAERPCLAEVRLWGRTLGAVYEPEQGPPVFEYAEEFRRSGLEVSPRHLPLRLAGPRTFPELRGLAAFEGLPGVLADALPDRFGNEVIRNWFAARGRPAEVSPVQKLLYVGGRAMGALVFRPALDVELGERAEEALELARLVGEARKIIEGETEVVLPEIMSLGASAGGARAKAVVLWNPATDELRSAFAPRRPGDEDWILKFDGVGELGRPDHRHRPFNRIEHAYGLMAAAAGIETAASRLLEVEGLAHYMTRRFDRDGDRRLHMHTLGGLEHVDYNLPGQYSYERWFRLVLELGLGQPALEQAFLRAAFNLVAVNQDDHVKNIAFLMDERGAWRLAPAYDLTLAKGQGYTRYHQMTFAGRREGFTQADLVEVAEAFGIRRGGRDVLAALASAIARWPGFAAAAGLDEARTAEVAAEFRRDLLPA